MPPQRSIALSAAFVKNVNQPGQYGDGHGGYGLRLRVRTRKDGSLSKTWAQKLGIRGRTVQLGLGVWPIVTLADAREQALENLRAAAKGRDPRATLRAREIPTFAEAAEQALALHQPTWKNPELEARIWRSSFRDYVLPAIGTKPVTEVEAADVLGVLTPIWHTKQETARRVRRRVGAVMRWCIAQGYRRDNPGGEAISQALPRHRGPRRNYPALHYRDVAGALKTVQASNSHIITKLCFEFLVLTAARSGEARLARWEEFNFSTATWIIPAERMKAARIHRVPLAKRALELLRQAQEIHDGGGLVFPSARGRELSNVTLSKLMKDLDIPAVPHGFRASFRTWAEEYPDSAGDSAGTDHAGFSRAVMEAALAHRVGDAAEQAYARSDLFAKRAELMEAWSTYLARPDPGAAG